MRNLVLVSVLAIFVLPLQAQTGVPPMEIKQRTLANGLGVYTVMDDSNPVVTVQVWYRVGGKDDPAGKSGFAHMFEHMMFKSTANMPNEMMDRLTEDVGGWNNASTREDLTNYYEVVPSNYLESLLWAESDRMVNLSVDAGNFASERDVVKEEYRQGVLANPYGMLFQYIDSLSFTVHPYKRGVIGNLDELNAASLEDAFKFYREYYRPDNASLIVVGDFDQEQLDKWIDKYFGRIKRPAGTIRRVASTEPDRKEPVRFVRRRPNVPECCPALAMTYFAPSYSSEDVPALEVAEAILSRGQSSRLYQALVYKKQLAQQAAFFADIRAEKGLLIFFAVAAGGKSLDDIEKAIVEEIGRLVTDPPTKKELEKAKNKIVTGLLQRRETANGKAVAIGEAIIYKNDAGAVNRDVRELRSVTVEDVVRVMKKYVSGANGLVIRYEKGEDKGGTK